LQSTLQAHGQNNAACLIVRLAFIADELL